MKTYEEFRQQNPKDENLKICENCKHWQPTLTEFNKMIIEYQPWYIKNTDISNPQVWVGFCDRKDDFDYYIEPIQQNEEGEYPQMVVGKLPSEFFSCFKHGAEVYFSTTFISLSTFNNFSCCNINQDNFEKCSA